MSDDDNGCGCIGCLFFVVVAMALCCAIKYMWEYLSS